ncbi:MAG: glycosyltransferase family 2 protein [Butyrivibrio sp.]|nr:glycosyltransferase family 2 protein [Butyrivibrio sp.]
MGSSNREETEVTIIIPNYNGSGYIEDCLKSIERQDIPVKTIIVDNGSSDDSIDIIKKKFPWVELVELGINTGFAHGVNVGIRQAQTEYIFLLNNDTILQNNTTSQLLKAIKHYKDAFSISSKMIALKGEHLIDDTGDYYCALGWAFTQGKDQPNNTFNKRKKVTSACAGAAIYKKSLLEKVGMFDDAHFCYLEDVDLGLRARIYGYNNYYEPGAVVYHVGSATSGSRHNAFKVRLTSANNLYMIYKNMPALMLIINLPLIIVGIVIKQFYFVKKHLGKAHFLGLIDGFKKIFTNNKKHVGINSRNLGNYVKLQIELWINCFKRIFTL